MIDLRNYKDTIRELVAVQNEKDENWKWSLKSVTKKKALIRWGYLDYLEEKENCFIIDLDSDEKAGDWLHARYPHGEMIEAYLMVEGETNPRIGAEQKIHSGLQDAIEEIAYIAHNYY